jgi:hypothetical protein
MSRLPVHDERHHKRCLRCGQSKPWGSFNHDRKKKDGHALECKGCEKQRKARAA